MNLNKLMKQAQKMQEQMQKTQAELEEKTVEVKAAGGTISNQLGNDGTNHYGFAFADPDGHKFNVLLIEEGM